VAEGGEDVVDTGRRAVAVGVSIPVFPTEDEEKILKGLHKVFPLLEFSRKSDENDSMTGSMLHAEGSMSIPIDSDGRGWTGCLETLREKVFSQRILDTFRYRLLHGNPALTEMLLVLLNKQAIASSGRINVVDLGDSIPLGTIRLEIRGNGSDLETFLNWLAPRTDKGVPVTENPADA